jgi:2-amino-4-hydroxy-6-hydroxymethyldihydropteridine diphosphokinase
LHDPQNQPILCYVALGSNLGDSVSHIMHGLQALANHSELDYLNISHFYQSKPYGPQDQPDYINAVVEFETTLKAEALLDELQKVENDNGRIREGVERWGARTLDLDLLFYGDDIINTERLTVPHPRICERAFVLYPLRDLIKEQDLKISEKTTLKECIARLSEKVKSEIKEYLIDD